jgi:thiamine-phosphate pyrophosphorylase
MSATFSLPKIYPITDRTISGTSHLEQVRALIEGGAKVVQLRDKTAPSLELFNDVRECLSLARQYGVRLIVNDRVDIALALGVDGVHLGQDDLPPAAAREILGGIAILGFSTHNVEQAIAAWKLPVDYIAIGPIFSTRTKEDHDPTIGLNGIEEIRKIVGEVPIVAIGGIELGSIKDVLSAGADSVALISAIVSEPTQISRNTHRAFAIANDRT